MMLKVLSVFYQKLQMASFSELLSLDTFSLKMLSSQNISFRIGPVDLIGQFSKGNKKVKLQVGLS